MSINGIDNNTGINPNYMAGKKRVLGNNFKVLVSKWVGKPFESVLLDS